MFYLVYGSVLVWRNLRCDLMMGDILILEIFNVVMLMIIEFNIMQRGCFIINDKLNVLQY